MNKLILALLTPLVASVVFLFTFVGHAEAAEGCSPIFGASYICTNVSGYRTYVYNVASIYAGPTRMCNTSAFAYYVPPGGNAISLGYQSRSGCQAFGVVRAYFTIPVNRTLPANSRVCTKFMVSGTSVGPEPCVKIK